MLKIQRNKFFHLHTHSHFSHKDAISPVQDLVERAKSFGQPALGLTDHGNMAGSVQLYQSCRKAGILPFPGIEAYFIPDKQFKKSAKRTHLGLLAHSTEGYEALVALTTRSHTRDHFHHKPLIDFADLAEWKENGWTQGLVLTSGCYFGLLVQTLLSEGYDRAKHVMARFASLVPNACVEIQNHQIDHGDVALTEDGVAAALRQLADELGLPLVLTQDAHYCDPSDKPVHEALKRLSSFGPDPDDAVFPGDGFHLCDIDWIREHHTADNITRADEAFGHLLDLYSLAIPELDTYHYSIPHITHDPDTVLRERCVAEAKRRCLPHTYEARFEEEMSVLTDTGMAGYLLLVAEVTDWCKSHDVFFQTRGSAPGSLLCWLLGITSVDPLKYQLRYERFISRDRTKPPDIDLDIEDTRRDELIMWLRERFNVCQIGTWARYGLNDTDDGKGSLIVAEKMLARRVGAEDFISPESHAMLVELDKRVVYKNPGTHAAGLIITTTKREFERLCPTMYIPGAGSTEGSVVSQYAMGDVESLGLVKLDILGLKTLTSIRRATSLIGKGTDLDWIPLADDETLAMIRKGDTEGVFQLEGGTAQRGCRELKPRSLKDIILIMALYRPAVMKAGFKDMYLARRNGVEKVPEMHPILMKHLKETFGIVVFQEQVISILRDLGITPDDLTALLKAVKASNANIGDAGKVIESYRERVSALCETQGMTVEDTAFLWSSIQGFAAYGFNRAHATIYGLTAYWTAYLKKHYRLEYATGMLQTHENSAKESQVIRTVRMMGVRVLSPHVNRSGASYTVDARRGAVRKGLLSIKGIGPSAAQEVEAHGPYESVEQIIERCNGRRVTGGKGWQHDRTLCGHLDKLREAGALDGLLDRQWPADQVVDAKPLSQEPDASTAPLRSTTDSPEDVVGATSTA